MAVKACVNDCAFFENEGSGDSSQMDCPTGEVSVNLIFQNNIHSKKEIL